MTIRLPKELSPWKTLSSEIKYSNPWIKVREDQVLRPDGNPGIYGVVESRPAIGVVALTENHEIYLVGQFRYATGIYSWEIIEGGGEPNEELVIGAKRELIEEAGVEAENWQPLGGVIHLSNSHSSERAYLFLATGLTEKASNPEPTEQLKITKVSLKDAVELVESGEIVDAMSIIGILRASKLYK